MTAALQRERPRTQARADELKIAGVVPMSTVDWPGQIVATAFCQGCPWRCSYCHNPSILDPRAAGSVGFNELRELLSRRHGLLDGVVFSGGEATMQRALVPAAREFKASGFKVGLHTGGSYPTRLRELLFPADGQRLLDWVGFDVKAPSDAYAQVVGVKSAWMPVAKSLALVLDSGIPHELRMTVTPDLCKRVPDVIRLLVEHGANHLVLQQARPDGTGPDFAKTLLEIPDWPQIFTRTVETARAITERLAPGEFRILSRD